MDGVQKKDMLQKPGNLIKDNSYERNWISEKKHFDRNGKPFPKLLYTEDC